MRTDFQITRDEISLASIHAGMVTAGSGAQLIFVGTVRDCNDGRAVSGLTYDAFEPLALKVFEQLAAEVSARWPVIESLTIVHRIGFLALKEISTVIGVGAAHRAESYEASRYVIEELKSRVPIWKEEHYVDGNQAWLGGVELRAGDCVSNTGGRKV